MPEYVTLIYWKSGQQVIYYPVPASEVDRIIKLYQQRGYNCAPYSPELLQQIIKNYQK